MDRNSLADIFYFSYPIDNILKHKQQIVNRLSDSIKSSKDRVLGVNVSSVAQKINSHG